MQSDPDLDRLLSTTLRSSRAADDCPDADRLAAFAEQAMTGDEVAVLERHVSNCARCTAILSTLLDSAPAATVAPSALWSWHAWRWVVPAATAVLIAGLWFSASRPQPSDATVEKPLVIASRAPDAGPADRFDTQPVPERDKPDERARAVDEKREAAGSNATALRQEKADVRADAKDREPQFAPNRSANEVAPQSAVASVDAIQGLTARTADAPPPVGAGRLQKAESAPAPASASPAPAQGGAAASEPTLRDAAKETAPAEQKAAVSRRSDSEAAVSATTPAAPPPSSAAAGAAAAAAPAGRGGFGGLGGAGGGRGGRAAPPALTNLPASAPIGISGGSGKAQWRIRARAVERSDDGGTTWTSVYDAPRALSGGAVASDDTVWVVGQAGLIARGTSSSWTNVTAPAPVASVDFTGVSAVSTRGATVRTRDGRDFRTDDGGATWRQP